MRFNYNKNVETRDILIFGYPIPWNNYDKNKIDDEEFRFEVVKDIAHLDNEEDLERALSSGVLNFYAIDYFVIGKLIKQRFIDPSDNHNSSPTFGEFYEFMQKHPQVYANGYVLSQNREDYCVSLVGLFCKYDIHFDLVNDFEKFSKDADEVVLEPYLYCWYD